MHRLLNFLSSWDWASTLIGAGSFLAFALTTSFLKEHNMDNSRELVLLRASRDYIRSIQEGVSFVHCFYDDYDRNESKLIRDLEAFLDIDSTVPVLDHTSENPIDISSNDDPEDINPNYCNG
jgi:hypothetical protein